MEQSPKQSITQSALIHSIAEPTNASELATTPCRLNHPTMSQSAVLHSIAVPSETHSHQSQSSMLHSIPEPTDVAMLGALLGAPRYPQQSQAALIHSIATPTEVDLAEVQALLGDEVQVLPELTSAVVSGAPTQLTEDPTPT